MGTHRQSRLGGIIVLLTFVGTAAVSGDTTLTDSQAGSALSFDTVRNDWLKPVEDQRIASANGTFTSTSGMNLSDPFAVISSGSLWQDQQSANYSRALTDSLAMTCGTTHTTQDGSPDALGNALNAGASFKPIDALSVQGNVHNSSNDQSLSPVRTSGAGAAMETHLPLGSVVNVAVNSDQTHADPGFDVQTNAYDAQLQKPVGKLPLTLLLKGHYVETTNPGAGASRLPSLEQSLVWKAGDSTTLQAGLRQEQYQNFPGITNELNEALFADWSQKLLDNVSWHSYAEMMNSRSTVEIAAAGAGTNGTAQPDTSNGGTSLTSALPVSITDEKLTFSTGPSFKIQKDVSASVEYSNTWDQNPAIGAAAQEQRVSVSLKGTF